MAAERASIEPISASGPYAGLAVSEDGSIVVGRIAASATRTPGSLVTVSPEGEAPVEPAIPPADACSDADILVPHTLPDGRLAAVRSCPIGGAADLIARKNQGWEQLLGLPVTPRGITWVAAPGSGFIALGSDVCASIARLDEGEVKPINLTVRDGEREFRLSDALGSISGGECTEDGRASWPAVGPRGELAFFASPASVGVSGQARLDAPWILVSWDPDSGELTTLATDVYEPRGLTWIGDRGAVAFAGRVGSDEGTWLLDGEAPTQLTSDVLEWVAWEREMVLIGLVRDNGGEDLSPVRLVATDASP
jgi:hypothetical protein